jgi:hypothetical protein
LILAMISGYGPARGRIITAVLSTDLKPKSSAIFSAGQGPLRHFAAGISDALNPPVKIEKNSGRAPVAAAPAGVSIDLRGMRARYRLHREDQSNLGYRHLAQGLHG